MSRKPYGERARSVLLTAVKSSGVTQTRIERALGMSKGYLSQVFSGRIELKLWHLEVILEEIGFEPQEFFRLAYPRQAEGQQASTMEQFAAYASRRAGPPELPPPASGLPDELRSAVREMVREVLAEETAAVQRASASAASRKSVGGRAAKRPRGGRAKQG
ncbi:MAG TPA: hypothetical protein VIH93_06360 [Thermoanaerobaculia bacterium]